MQEEEKKMEEAPVPAPEAPEALPEESALRAELETLREEKRLRELTQKAEGLLRESGIPEDFASLLLGTDGEDTARRVAAFGQLYLRAVQEKLRSVAPPAPPRDLSLAPAPARRRGIRKL